MRRSIVLACLLASAGVIAAPSDALARDRKDRQDRHERREAPSLRDERPNAHRADRSAAAARRAQAQNGGGRVLSVEPENGGYRVKVLKDGEVRTHRVEGD